MIRILKVHTHKQCDLTGLDSIKVEGINILGELCSRVLPFSTEYFIIGMREYVEGARIQDAFPEYSTDDREFLISGIENSPIWEECEACGEAVNVTSTCTVCRSQSYE
jgi:hypothetical protein